ncbi:MAG TPA: PEP-CTERM sorting domain-containing protein [Candidatus Polarisedimenticolia bacterium]|nr:PEP-CTERM sorting domain-containing protein [Candidatus Polarisedimenticolia bacterium]
MLRRYVWPLLSAGLLLLAMGSATRADSFTFSADPADVSGTPGSTVGWGYTFTTDSANADYLVLVGIDSTLFLSTNGTPDASIFDYPILAPGQTLSVAYDPIGWLGLFQFTWDPNVPVGTTETGTFDVTAQFCSDPFDPSTCGNFITLSAPFSATVVSPGGVAVPEPPTAALLGSGLLMMLGMALFRRPRAIPQ